MDTFSVRLRDIVERCASYRQSNKGSKERQGPTLGVRFTEVSVKRESTVECFQSSIKSTFVVALVLRCYAL